MTSDTESASAGPKPILQEMTIQHDSTPTNGAERPTEPSISARITPEQWLQVLSTFIVFLNTWGLLLTFGVLQTYYEQVLLSEHSSSNISWISTTCAFILLAGGVVTGPLYDRGFYRALVLAGSLFQVFGLIMMSLSTQYYHFFLSQAICVGFGAAMAFTPSVAAAAACFKDNAIRAKFMGLMACGSSIGGIIYPIMFRRLLSQAGFAWAVRSIAFVVLATYTMSYAVFIYNTQKGAMVRRSVDASALTDLPFLVLSVASLFSATAYYIPLLYLPLMTEIRVPTIDADLAFYLLAIMNGASAAGRILAGIVAAKLGPTETILIALVFGSMLLFCWIVIDSLAKTLVWCIFWGMISGVLVALPGAFIPLFSPSLAVIGTRSGMYWVWVGLGLLIGSPIGGALLDLRSTGTDWWRLPVFAGVFMMVAALLTVYPVIYLRRKGAATS